MAKDVTESLEVRNFLSIKDIKWEFEHFNIITGDMGAGKSLCIKLIKFFEQIVPNLLVIPYATFLNFLDIKQFSKYLIDEFIKIFILDSNNSDNQVPFYINYIFSYKEEFFNITIKGETNKNNISIDSPYLTNLLNDWNNYIKEKNANNPEKITPDGFNEIKRLFYADLLKKFNGHFPMATTFIPASRAALAFNSSHGDIYLKEYQELLNVLAQYKSNNMELINTILKAKIKINGSLFLESDDGRRVPIANASSGQQEIVYVLMLLDKLGNFAYTYGNKQSLFIEEPEAHLFPMEQKQTIELIVNIYNSLKESENSIRIFITTHSPYVLNSLNNILNKGSLLEKYTEQTEKINNTINIPSLYADEISAYFINSNGTWENMLDMEHKYLFADKIVDISYNINEDTSKLRLLNNELLCEKD